MALRRRLNNGLDAWPGYVDALSTLLMVIIFVLLVFVLGQAFLSVALSGRDRALDRLNREMAALTDMLSLERDRSHELQLSVAGLTRDLDAASAARQSLASQVAALGAAAQQSAAERDALRAERDRLAAQLADAELEAKAAASRMQSLQARLATEAGQSGLAADQAAAALAEARNQLAARDATIAADRQTIAARLADLARLAHEVSALTALRDELEAEVRDAAAKATTAAQQRAAMAAELAGEQRYADTARAEIALLNAQMEQLRAQLGALAAALDISAQSVAAKNVQIADLGRRLNLALASKVEELQRYRSVFFGRLRAVLANRPGIAVVGDRFVFQSEVLFPAGSAALTPDGAEQIRALAATLKQIAPEIPKDVNWMLRVDGHADRQPVTKGSFPSNWELSSARAITVVRLLIAEGIPANRLAATGFAEFQPLDAGDTPAAYARNRRIELRLTDR